MKKVTIYTDGACSGNPGPGGYGAVLMYDAPTGDTIVKEISGGFASTTNNRMEITAVIEALKLLNQPCLVDLYSDSQYVINSIEKGWMAKWKSFGWYKDAKHKEVAKNKDLWIILDQLMSIHTITTHWVKGHATNVYNNRCDELATTAILDKDNLKEDKGVF